MRDPLSRDFSALQSNQDSWMHRVRENFRQLFTPANIFPSSANGATLHLVTIKSSATSGGARTVSLLGHAALIAAILLVKITTGTGGTKSIPTVVSASSHTIIRIPQDGRFGQPSLGKKGGGGEEDFRPATHGLFPPTSSMPLVPPRHLQEVEAVLPVPAAVFDANAPQFTALVTKIGLPWMKKDSDSAGPGKNHGIGSGRNGGVGDDDGPGAGEGDSYGGPFANITSAPKCAYCPDPEYTDEAREAKLQGHVLLQVLVSADGRASQVRIVQGIGLGLDERAAQAIRTWKFVPAYDAGHKAVSSWVTVEAVFRLF